MFSKQGFVTVCLVILTALLITGCLPTTPTPVAVTGVTLDQATMTLTAGGATGTLVATVAPATTTNKSVTWSSSAPAVATVSVSGVVTPLTAGTTIITVTTVDGSKTATRVVTVTITPVAATAVAVTFSNLTANGTSAVTTTTILTLTFDIDPTTLAVGDITVTGATKGTLSGTGTTRTLAISNITVVNGADVTVAIADPAGFAITPASKTVAVNVAATAVVFSNLTANGTSAVTTTTILTLTFDIDPTTLAVGDITVTGEIFSLYKERKRAEEARYKKYPNFQAKGPLLDRTLESFM